jgi:uncharacterized protein (TIGR02246 family)
MLDDVSQAEARARLEIGLTIGRYVEASDEGNLDDFAALFAQDGVLAPPGVPECRGREAIRAFIAASRASRENVAGLGRIRHHVASIRIEFEDAELAYATSYFTAMSAKGPDHWGVYRDELRPSEGAWLFQRRTVTIEGADPKGWIGSGAGVAKFVNR